MDLCLPILSLEFLTDCYRFFSILIAIGDFQGFRFEAHTQVTSLNVW